MRTLPPVPDSYLATMNSLHAVAERVLSPLRVEADGADHTQLTPWPGGFGTPELADGRRAGVVGTELVVVDGDGERRAPLTTLRKAAEHVGLDAKGLPDEPLEIDTDAAALLAKVYELAETGLDKLRADGAVDASPSHLWPEHFDIAFDQGAEKEGGRAGYGVSPGDEHHPEPYAYVGPWEAPPPGSLWQATGFPGAELGWSELVAAEDPIAVLLDFWRTRRDTLAGARTAG